MESMLSFPGDWGRTKWQALLFNASHQLISMSFIYMTVPYLFLKLHASYYHVAVILGCMQLGECVWFLYLSNLACCKPYDKQQFIMQVFISIGVMIGSSMAFYTIPIWPDVNDGNFGTLIFILAALFCSLTSVAFLVFVSRANYLYLFDNVKESPTRFMGRFLGVAIWAGLLQLPIDFQDKAYWLIGLVNLIIFSFACMIILAFYRTKYSQPTDSGIYSIDCCEIIRTFGCPMWLSWFLALFFLMSMESFHFFLMDWYIRCSDLACSQESNPGLHGLNYPVRSYSYLLITSSAFSLLSWTITKFCESKYYLYFLGLMSVLAIGMFNTSLFAIGYTGNQSWWTILFFVSHGLMQAPYDFFSGAIDSIYKHENELLNRYDRGIVLYRVRTTLYFIGPLIGVTLVSSIAGTFDYLTLFRILGVLASLTGISMITLYIRICLLMTTNTDSKKMLENVSKISQAKPRLFFRKPTKST
jgi:hypothetical protein